MVMTPRLELELPAGTDSMKLGDRILMDAYQKIDRAVGISSGTAFPSGGSSAPVTPVTSPAPVFTSAINATTASFTPPDGSTLVIEVISGAGGRTANITDSGPGLTYTSRALKNDLSNCSMQVFTAHVVTGVSMTITATWSAGITTYLRVRVYTGVNPAAPVGAVFTGPATDTTTNPWNPTTYVSTMAGSLLSGCAYGFLSVGGSASTPDPHVLLQNAGLTSVALFFEKAATTPLVGTTLSCSFTATQPLASTWNLAVIELLPVPPPPAVGLFTGMLFKRTDLNKPYYWNGTSWVEILPSSTGILGLDGGADSFQLPMSVFVGPDLGDYELEQTITFNAVAGRRYLIGMSATFHLFDPLGSQFVPIISRLAWQAGSFITYAGATTIRTVETYGLETFADGAPAQTLTVEHDYVYPGISQTITVGLFSAISGFNQGIIGSNGSKVSLWAYEMGV